MITRYTLFPGGVCRASFTFTYLVVLAQVANTSVGDGGNLQRIAVQITPGPSLSFALHRTLVPRTSAPPEITAVYTHLSPWLGSVLRVICLLFMLTVWVKVMVKDR